MSDLVCKALNAFEYMLELPVISLMGPTAVGKTDLAIDLYKLLADKLPIDIISVDSAMVYRGLNIGTGKPELSILQDIPHGLVDIREPYEIYSVADFCNDAIKLIKTAHLNNRIPLLVGGTMMYFNALRKGLSELPGANTEIRAELLNKFNANGLTSLYQELVVIDPIAAARINPNDKQRILRALEVYLATGKTKNMTDLLNKNNNNFIFKKFNNINIIIAPEADELNKLDNRGQSDGRRLLHNRIEQRFYKMLDDGFIAEVENLYNNQLVTSDLPAMRSCGYQQVWQYLAGNITKKQMVEQSIIATRQLAKRQMTWLRSWDKTSDKTFWFNTYINSKEIITAEIIKILNF